MAKPRIERMRQSLPEGYVYLPPRPAPAPTISPSSPTPQGFGSPVVDADTLERDGVTPAVADALVLVRCGKQFVASALDAGRLAINDLRRAVYLMRHCPSTYGALPDEPR